MNDAILTSHLDPDFDPLTEVDTDPDATEGAESLALFEGDLSRLYPDQRRCLHALLKRRYLSAEHDPDLWRTLLDNTELMTSRLNDLFLTLFMDRQRGIAFKQPAPDDGEVVMPSLLRAVASTKEETIIMVYLRHKMLNSRQEGDEAVFVDRSTLIDQVAQMRPEHATNRALDRQRTIKAIDRLIRTGILLGDLDADRLQISPIIEILLPIDKLIALRDWLIGANQSHPSNDGADHDDDAALTPLTSEENDD